MLIKSQKQPVSNTIYKPKAAKKKKSGCGCGKKKTTR
jgi:hypothetical protein